MANSACLGFVAVLGSVNLRWIIGRLVADERNIVTLAIDKGDIPDLPPLAIKTDAESVCTIGLARVPASDTVSDFSGWTKACQAPEVWLSDLRRAYYRSDKVRYLALR